MKVRINYFNLYSNYVIPLKYTPKVKKQRQIKHWGKKTLLLYNIEYWMRFIFLTYQHPLLFFFAKAKKSDIHSNNQKDYK